MRRWVVALFAVALSVSSPSAQTNSATTLDIYVIDVEGGNATLFVSPVGESLLIDSGNAGPGAVRDAERIVAAAKAAGLTSIDTLITTHWHGDHYGGIGHRRIPPEGVSAALREGAASRREAWRQRADGGTERDHRVVGRRGAQNAASGRRRTEPVVRELQTRAR